MTELMKRYEAETGDSFLQAMEFNKVSYYMACYKAWLEREYHILQAENAQLKAQLTWRPVSETPKEGQIVFAVIQTGWVVAQYFHGEFYVDDGFTFGDRISGVTYWLPIPPMEVK